MIINGSIRICVFFRFLVFPLSFHEMLDEFLMIHCSGHVLVSSEFYRIYPEESDVNGLELATITGGVQRETRENMALGRSCS